MVMKRVLLIDEKTQGREALVHELRYTHRIGVETADTHQEWLQCFRNNSDEYAAIIMETIGKIPQWFSEDEKRATNDWLETGYLIEKKIREINKEIPIVLYSVDALRQNIDGKRTIHLRKPELAADIAKLILDVIK